MCLATVEEKERQEEKQKIEELKAYIDQVKDMEYSNSYLIAVLHRAQKIYRYLREDIIKEIAATRITERGGRYDDRRSEAAMEDRKKIGYF